MKALSTKALTTSARAVGRALRYPTYQRLALQRTLLSAGGSILMGIGNLCSLGAAALHGSGGFMVTAHLVAVVFVAPIVEKKAGI